MSSAFTTWSATLSDFSDRPVAPSSTMIDLELGGDRARVAGEHAGRRAVAGRALEREDVVGERATVRRSYDQLPVGDAVWRG